MLRPRIRRRTPTQPASEASATVELPTGRAQPWSAGLMRQPRLVATATVLELPPMATSQTATSCLCTGCNGGRAEWRFCCSSNAGNRRPISYVIALRRRRSRGVREAMTLRSRFTGSFESVAFSGSNTLVADRRGLRSHGNATRSRFQPGSVRVGSFPVLWLSVVLVGSIPVVAGLARFRPGGRPAGRCRIGRSWSSRVRAGRDR